jgi:hypothetical protein
MEPGNRKGTNPGPPDRTRRTRRTAFVLRMPPPVLSGTAANCGPPFGTKRPQVQILSPRLYSRRPEALTRVGEGLSCCQYRSKIPQVPQQIRTLTCSWNGFPQPAQRFAGTKRPQAKVLSPRPEFPQVIPEGRAKRSTRKGSPQAALRFEGRHRPGVRIDPQRHRHVCVTPDRMITRGWTSRIASVAHVRLAS